MEALHPFAQIPDLDESTGHRLEIFLRPYIGCYFRTTQTIANPWRDKRGSEGHPNNIGEAATVESGLVLRVTTTHAQRPVTGMDGRTEWEWTEVPAVAYEYRRINRVEALYLSLDGNAKSDVAWRQVLLAMLRSAEEYTPTISEIVAFEYDERGHAKVLEALGALGLKVTPGSVRLAISACTMQDDEEQAEYEAQLEIKRKAREAARREVDLMGPNPTMDRHT